MSERSQNQPGPDQRSSPDAFRRSARLIGLLSGGGRSIPRGAWLSLGMAATCLTVAPVCADEPMAAMTRRTLAWDAVHHTFQTVNLETVGQVPVESVRASAVEIMTRPPQGTPGEGYRSATLPLRYTTASWGKPHTGRLMCTFSPPPDPFPPLVRRLPATGSGIVFENDTVSVEPAEEAFYSHFHDDWHCAYKVVVAYEPSVKVDDWSDEVLKMDFGEVELGLLWTLPLYFFNGADEPVGPLGLSGPDHPAFYLVGKTDRNPILAAGAWTIYDLVFEPSAAGEYRSTLTTAHGLTIQLTGVAIPARARPSAPVAPVAAAVGPGDTGNVRLSWDSIPGQSYLIETTSNLLLPWIPLPGLPAPLVALHPSLSHTVPAEDQTGFFRIYELYPAQRSPPDLVSIEPGTFTMGSPTGESGRHPDEGPLTQVTFTRGFFMGRYPVTQREYLALMGVNPSRRYLGDLDRPVERVSWVEATHYCQLLTQAENEAGRLPVGWEFRLPTEAQWEYACRAGTTTPFGIGTGTSLGSAEANFQGAYPYGGAPVGPRLMETTPVGSYEPNAWGLYDLHGNVWEWCADWYEPHLPGGEVTDWVGPAQGVYRSWRGGGWRERDGRNLRSAFRSGSYPGTRSSDLGFRVVLVQIK